MKIYCRGFNLFGQLQDCRPILKEFTPVFNFEVIDEVYFNLAHTVVYSEHNCYIYQQEGRSKLIQSSQDDILLIASNDDILIYMDKNGKIETKEFGNFENISKKNLMNSQVKFDTIFTNDTITNITCGSKLIVLHTASGKLCKIIDGASQILQFTCNFLFDIKCGREHCLLLDQEGNVYSFGRGSRGQLGHGKLDDEQEPVLVEALAGIKIKQIAVGAWHSCAISKEGDLYTWGWNSNGQLGLGIEDGDPGFVSVQAMPHVVDFIEQHINPVYIACGSRHTIIYFENGQLYGCGWNKYHQLTKEIHRNYYKLTHLHNFKDENVLEIQCGPWNSAVQCN